MVVSKCLKVCFLLPCLLLEWVLNSWYFQVISPYFQKVANAAGVTGRSYAPFLCYFLDFICFQCNMFLSRHRLLFVYSSTRCFNVNLVVLFLRQFLNFFFPFLVSRPQLWQAKPKLRRECLVAACSVFGHLPCTTKLQARKNWSAFYRKLLELKPW